MNCPLIVPGGNLSPLNTAVDFTIWPAQSLVLDGDSVTQGHNNSTGLTDATFRWSVQFEASLSTWFTSQSLTAPIITNTAVGGRTSTTTAANVATPIAAKPDHIFLLSSVNDQFNSIAPSTTAANYATYIAAVQAAWPGCRIHVLANLWGSTEHFPDGSNPEDAGIDATNAAIVAQIKSNPFCTYYDLRTPLFSTDEPNQNTANAASGILLQGSGGYHPTKVATSPGTQSGQQVISNRVFALVTLGV